ncbi:hypothetical protein AAC387_Pa06g1011 [Persea americana]
MKEAAANAMNRTMKGPAHRLGTRHITQVRHELRAEGSPVDKIVAAPSLQTHHPLLGHLTLAVATGRDMTRLERAVMIRQARLILTRY